MSFNKYYQEELAFLRGMGKEFANAYPLLGQFLTTPGTDPDVERMLDGFAFLTARVKQKLDDEFPEIVQGMMNLLWPHYLRPIPAMSMLKFEPIPAMVRDLQRIPRGTEVKSTPISGTSCLFRTCYDVDILPVKINNVALDTPLGRLQQLKIQFFPTGDTKINQLSFEKLQLHLFGEPSYDLYLWLCKYVKNMFLTYAVKTKQGEDKPKKHITLDTSLIEPVGFEQTEALLPYPAASFDGYRLLQEYFALPSKFMFINIGGMSCLRHDEIEGPFDLVIEFSRPLPSSMRVTADNVLLNCTPVVNIFYKDADPVRIEHNKSEYLIRPTGVDAAHYEIYSVDKVSSWVKGRVKERVYDPFFSFRHDFNNSEDDIVYYNATIRERISGQGTETYLSFVNNENSGIIPETEVVAINLTCINRLIPGLLKAGDIKVPTDKSPEFVRFANITNVTQELSSPFSMDIYWRLLSHMSLNYLSLANVEALRSILTLYNFQALYDQQATRANELRLEGIKKIETRKTTRLYKGAPVSGIALEFHMQEDCFAGDGDMYLFSTILSEFLSLYVSINSFTELTVRGVQEGEIYKWKPKIGKQRMI